MTEQRTRLDPIRLELIRRRLAAAGVTANEDGAPEGSADVMSFGQQRLWFLDQLTPGTSAYHVPAAVRIRGPVEPGILHAALSQVAARHAVLRARFSAHDGRPRQRIDPPNPVALPVVGRGELGPDPLAGALDAARVLAEEPFDLTTGPLLRATLYRLADDDHVLAVVVHHIACDGASAAILVREVCSTCLALAAGRAVQPPPLARQYWSYAQLQADQEAAGAWAAQVRFWRETLGDLTAPLPLPEDRGASPDAAGPGRAERVTRRLDRALAQAVGELAARHDATVFMVLLAAWHAQLARRTGAARVPVATPVNTRSRTEYEPLIGFFVNTLVMLGDASGDPTFAELLGRTRARTVAALGHQDVPFEVLVRELNPPRSLGDEPLAQVLFSYQPDPPYPPQSGAVAFEPLPIGAPRAKYSLTLYLSADDDGLLATMEYDATRWQQDTVADWLVAYERLLADVCRDDTRRVSAVDRPDQPVLAGPPAEELVPIVASVGAWVDRTPEAIALVDDAGPLRYDALAAAAAGLAHALSAAGAGPERPVLVSVPRGRETVIATLAALLVGAPFVPVDLTQPARRVAAIVQGARAGVAVVSPTLADAADTALPWDVLRIDPTQAAPGDPAVFCAAASAPRGPAADLAYLMFTSGSTGVPKGVAVRESALAALLAAFASLSEAGPDDVTLAMTTTTFDISVLELLLPLTTGGTLRVIGDAARLDPAAIAGVLAQDGVTIAQATPTTWRALLASGWQPPRPMRLLCGGEALDGALAERLRATGCTVWNVYGPTETTIWSTAHSLDRTPATRARPTLGAEAGAGASPLGQPLAGQHLVVLGSDGVPTPLGTPGELAIGGVGLARGYWGDPRTTAARFVPDPFAAQPGARLYRTGDVVRRRADDTLEFLGRRDDQVKIRGHRVEPGEVAAEVARLPSVGDCAVVAAHGGLVAFVTRGPGSAVPSAPTERPSADQPGRAAAGLPTADDDEAWTTTLRMALTDLLPPHLVPARIHVLDRLPVTPAGKRDRTALRDLAETRPTGRQPAPGNEARIAGIWTELLGRPTLADEDFFAAGGHSLLATQLARRVAEVTGAPIRVRHVFERPTIAGLAELVDAADGHVQLAGHPQDSDRDHGSHGSASVPDIGLSSAQLRLVFLQRLEPESTAYHVTLAARFDEALDETRLRDALAALVSAHPALRTAVLDSEGAPARIVAASATMPLRVADAPARAVLDADTVAEVAAPELHEPFDLSRAPLARAVLVRGDEDCALVLVAHHVILDGWSAQLLTAQLQRAYRGDPIGGDPGAAPGPGGRGTALPDPGSPGNTADPATQRTALDRAASRITAWPRTLTLPLRDTGKPPGSAGHIRLPIGHVPGDALAGFTRAYGVTSYPVLLAAWTVALARACDQPRLLVGAPYAGRDRPRTQDVVGLLATTLVIAADTRGDPTFADLVEGTAAAVRAALVDADVPFDALVARTVTDRQLGRTPLFQTMFAYEETAPGPALAGTVLRLPTTAAKVPVGLWLAATSPEQRSPGWTSADVSGELEYDASLLSAEFAATLIDEFVAVLTGGLADPRTRVSDLGRSRSGGGLDARPGVVAPRPATAPRTDPAPSSVLHLLDPARLTDPDALAVDGPDALSYGELWRRAGTIADRVRTTGVRTEEPIGVLVRSDVATYATILGVLRAGATYVPLDPESPASWRNTLAERAGIRHVHDPAAGPSEPAAPPRPGSRPISAEPLPEQAAYVIHTSGSSGRPKAVVVPHRALAGYAVGAAHRYGLRPTDRVLQLATLVYDGSVEELVVTWAAGATVVPAPPDVRGTTGPLLAFLEQAGITVLCLTTAHWHALAVELASGRSSVPVCLRLVLFGGEAADPRHAEEWLAHAPRADVVDTYGPTEATVVASTTPIRSVDDAGRIGAPLPGVGLEVLCRDGRAATAGQLGELCIGGVGVARGYVGDPRATAASFVPDPHGQPGARRYRTGDLVRCEPDGAVRFAGRRDHELKVRGFRVEPSVVEAALLSCPGVTRAAVTVDGDRLVGGVEAADPAPEPAALRATVATLLPAHLVPNRIVVMDALPLTDRGKVDRPAIAHAARRARRQPTTADTERPATDASDPVLGTVVQVWSDVLGEPVGPHDDFFTDLGGHSLLALRLAHESSTALGRDVPVRAVFEAPTPVALAEWVRVHRAGHALPPIECLDAPSGPLSVAQERIWRMQQAAPGTAQFTMAATARLDRALDPQLLAQAWHVLSLRHDLLRWRIRPSDSGAPEFVVDPNAASILVHDLRVFPAARAQAAVADLVASARRHAFDLADEPPVMLVQLRLGESDVLVLAAHHVACDDATISTLFTELAAIYRTIAEDVPLALPGRGPSAGDYAAWERAALADGSLDAEREHWRQVLRPPLGRLSLLADPDGAPAGRLLETTTEVLISGEPRATLTRLAASARTTPFTVMLALVMRAMAAVTGQSDVRVATMAANRQAPDRAGLVGLLTNTVVVRCAVPASLEDTVAGVRVATLDAFEHQELPFEVVLADLDPAIRPEEVAPVLLLWSRAEADGRGAVDRVAPQGASGFELVVDVVERSDRLDVTLVHEQDSTDVATRLADLLSRDLTTSSGGRA